MHKQTKAHQFSKKVQKNIYRRDNGICIFCRENYHMHCKNPMLYELKDVMHYINKSAGGVGVEENGALGCRYHHSLLDNGNKGLRKEMLEVFRQYLKNCYPNWNEAALFYKKYNF